MKKVHSRESLALPLVILLFLLTLACGGGGGGAASGPQSTPQNLRTKIQPASLFNILPGTTFSIQSISGSQDFLLPEVALNGDDFQSFELTFNFSENYIFAANRYGVPFLRTVLLGSQIEKASESGVLNIGEVNAITTFFADLSNPATNIAKPSRRKSEPELRNLMSAYFNINASFDFSQLSFDNINSGALTTTNEFDGVANRINLLLFFIGTVADLSTTPSVAQISALRALYSGITDSNTSVSDLTALLESSNLPRASDGGADLLNRIVSGGFAIQTDNSLGLSDVLSIFNNPSANSSLLQQAISLATSQISGAIGGYRIDGIELHLKNSSGNVLQSTMSLSNGDYLLKGLEAGSYEVSPQKEGFVFRPAAFKVELSNNQKLKGFDFNTFKVVNGSLDVPAPDKVVRGTTYTDMDGTTQLEGLFSVLAPAPSKVLAGVFYGDETGLALSGNLVLPSPNEVLSGVNYGPGGNDVGTASVTVVRREAPRGVGSTSRFSVSYY
jgi:hypothetical protein